MTEKREMYLNIYRLFRGIDDDKITNVHSVDKDKTPDGKTNIVFDYKDRLGVRITIDDNLDINIEATNLLAEMIGKIIVRDYPEYEDKIYMIVE